MLTFYYHSFVQDTHAFILSPNRGNVCHISLFRDRFLHKKKNWHPFLSPVISFISGWPVYRPAALVPYSRFCAHEAARWLCFCSALAQRSGLMSFLAPLSHSLLKVHLKDVDRWTATLTGRYKWEGKIMVPLSGVKGQMEDKTVSKHSKSAILGIPNQGNKKK